MDLLTHMDLQEQKLKRSRSAIGKANRAKGHRTMGYVRDLFIHLLGLRAYLIHRADGAPENADLISADGKTLLAGVQIKSTQEFPKWIENNLSDDGFCVLVNKRQESVFIGRLPEQK